MGQPTSNCNGAKGKMTHSSYIFRLWVSDMHVHLPSTELHLYLLSYWKSGGRGGGDPENYTILILAYVKHTNDQIN